MEKNNQSFTELQFAKASTYSLSSSLKPKLSRNEFGEFVVREKDGKLKAQNTIGATIEDYVLRTSSKYRHKNPVVHSTRSGSSSNSAILSDKSLKAAIAAIEIYNKPDFRYREESFVILFVNAWELLLKAKIVKDNFDRLDSIYLVDKKTNKLVLSRSGNAKSISIGKAIESLLTDKTLIDNLYILIELRDNSIHLTNEDKILTTKLYEVSTASLISYLELCKDWFELDLERYNFYIMPLTFFHAYEVKSYSISNSSQQIKNLIKFIGKKEAENPHDEFSSHRISAQLDAKFVKSNM